MARFPDPEPEPAEPEALAGALGLVAVTWGILGGAPLLFASLGRPAGHLLAFGLCTGVALWGHRPGPGTRRAVAITGVAITGAAITRAAITGAAGLAAGWALLPGFSAWILWAGNALGIPGPVPAGGGQNWPFLLATAVLAPTFEEIVYRERLLPALATRIGIAPALLLSSAAFALPHSTPWATLGSFSAGLVLGSAMLVGRSLALCIGMHSGFNLRLAGFSMESL